ncbi:MAG: oligosaccharide flippase family protein [Bacteroidia bacterium]|nr:oligosaccharide flippase family protein [Bacteroidia bacterium]MDW8134303.1 oligosaccharide flippase family protein [Bacteroidia bacterium]
MKTFHRDIIITLIANLITKPLWILADNLVQNRIGHTSYGLIGALLGLGQWAIAIGDWGLYALITREMAQQPRLYPSLIASTLTLKVWLTLFTLLLFLGLGWILGYREKQLLWLFALVLYQLSISYIQFFRAYFQGTQQFRIDALLSAVEKAIVVLLIFLAWQFLKDDIYVSILVLAGITSASLAGVWVWRRYGIPRWERNTQVLWQVFRHMTPFALLSYASAVNERLNQILLERWLGAYENGLYCGAYRWFSAAMMYLWIVMPLFFARFAQLGPQRSPELPRTFVWGHLVAALPLILVGGIFIGEPKLFLVLFTHSTPQEIDQMSQILQVMSVPLMINGIFIIYSTYLTALGYEWVAFWWVVGSALLNGITCLLSLPALKGVGATLGLAASYLLQGIGFTFHFAKVSPFLPPTHVLVRLGVLGIAYGG